jgi:hypoxanthine phosphoribosyltransferase
MTITYTSNYQETLSEETVKIVDELVESGYNLNEVLEYIDYFGEDYANVIELLIDAVNDNGSTKNELYEFVDEYGYNNVEYFGEYVRLLEDYSQEAVAAFINCFDVSDISLFEETYEGAFDSLEDFVYYILEQGEYNIPNWVVVDAEKTWNSALRFEYYEDDEYYFRHL